MKPRPIIAANWKMYHTPETTGKFIREFVPLVSKNTDVEIVLCPSFTSLGAASQALGAASPISLGGQNLYPANEGAFTGETSAGMLLATGCRYVILGHSERRTLFNESDAWINEKIRHALAAGLHVIFCVGETLEERESNRTESVLKRQVENGLGHVPAADLSRVVLAYEPVWAIGTGKTATPEMAQAAHAHIRSLLSACYDATIARATRIQYGGSVKPANAAELMAQPDINGALVGGASLEAISFAGIVNFNSTRVDA